MLRTRYLEPKNLWGMICSCHSTYLLMQRNNIMTHDDDLFFLPNVPPPRLETSGAWAVALSCEHNGNRQDTKRKRKKRKKKKKKEPKVTPVASKKKSRVSQFEAQRNDFIARIAHTFRPYTTTYYKHRLRTSILRMYLNTRINMYICRHLVRCNVSITIQEEGSRTFLPELHSNAVNTIPTGTTTVTKNKHPSLD